MRVVPASGSAERRLAEAYACLENLERQRAHGHAPILAKFVEDRIIWRELLELELQEFDEQIDRISAAAGGAFE